MERVSVCVREPVLCVGTCCVADQTALHAVITPEARVLMISPLWKNGHSVHRNFKDAVTALQGAFDVRHTSPNTHTWYAAHTLTFGCGNWKVSLLAFETSFLPRSFIDTEGFTSVAVVR